MGLVGDGGDGPAVPVEGAVFEIRNLRGESGVDVEGEARSKAEAKVAIQGDLVGAAVGQSGRGRQGGNHRSPQNCR